MYQLVIKPKAIEMAKDAYDWYNEQQPGLGDRFLQELNAGFDRLELWPIAYIKIKRIIVNLYYTHFLM